MQKYLEPCIWTAGLLLLFFMDAAVETDSICVFKLVGLQSCFGCGIGHAIHHALHLRFQQAFQAHIFGIPAAIGILYNILKHFITANKKSQHEPTTNAYDVARSAARRTTANSKPDKGHE